MIILSFVGFLYLSQKDKILTIETQVDLRFKLDTNNLSYTLPKYTKLCTPESTQACSSDGCKKVLPTVFLAYDESNNMIYRCDNKPCDGYLVEEGKSGTYTNITPVNPNGLAVKISNENKYMEVASMGLSTLTSYGSCK
jgi:hypothetical protein